MKLSFPIWAVGVSLLVLAGCSTPQSDSAKSFSGSSVINSTPARDKVLWEYRDALTALRRGQLDEAKRLLDDAILSIGGINVGDKDAKRARRFFSGEDKKTFIGEPYERVMAYYYRGILYWMDGEPDNARACFRSGQFQDSDTENKQYSSDYVLLDYLDGLASTKLASDGSDAFKRAQTASKSFSLPAYDTKSNVLFFLDYGSSPLKYSSGQYGEQLRFRERTSLAHSATIKVGGQTIRSVPNDDLYFQATTRGGRVMDHILANKAVFKSATSAAGDAAIISGAVLGSSQQGRHSNADEIGLGLALAGVASKIFSAATVPAADTRTWDNLPQYLSFAAISLPPGQHIAKVEFNDAQGRALPNLTKTVTINIPPGSRDNVIYVSDKSTNS
ncbi:MAG: hypothetical protein ABIR24_02610 [Verrucomicrobiota bacterium]